MLFSVSFVNLGSGVNIEIQPAVHRVNLLRPEKKKPIPKSSLPEMHAKEEEFMVDGETYKVERSILRYEGLEEVIDELPDFIREILDNK